MSESAHERTGRALDDQPSWARHRDPKKFENKLLLRLSRAAHELDVKNSAEPLGFQPRRSEDRRSAKSVAFERRWLGRS